VRAYEMPLGRNMLRAGDLLLSVQSRRVWRARSYA
jgi:hypothetical protein